MGIYRRQIIEALIAQDLASSHQSPIAHNGTDNEHPDEFKTDEIKLLLNGVMYTSTISNTSAP